VRTSALSTVHFVWLSYQAKRASTDTGNCAPSFPGLRRVGMDLVDATAIIIAGPFLLPVTHSGVDVFEMVAALPCISVTGGVSLSGSMGMLL
jgi:hypothetical protein